MSRVNQKHPSQFKYVAYIRVEIQNTIQYFHFYIENGKITSRKPHTGILDDPITNPVIRLYIKPNQKDNKVLNEAVQKKIQDMRYKYNVNFETVNDEW